jgi:hypothetical protein
MPPEDQDTSIMLKDYLIKQQKEPLQEAVRNLADNYAEHEVKDQKRHTEVLDRFSSYDYRIAQLERNAGLSKRQKLLTPMFIVLISIGIGIGISMALTQGIQHESTFTAH